VKLDIKHVGGNDLAVDFQCDCPHESFIGTDIEHLVKQRIHLYGYNDGYFFNVVNAEPRSFKCKCGEKYQQQWFADGYVEVTKLKEE
jgi:hypothetical protein